MAGWLGSEAACCPFAEVPQCPVGGLGCFFGRFVERRAERRMPSQRRIRRGHGQPREPLYWLWRAVLAVDGHDNLADDRGVGERSDLLHSCLALGALENVELPNALH